MRHTHHNVIVLGLGAMGSAATYQLAKQGADVLGIDQYQPPHEQGSTHGDTRATRLATFEGPELVAMVRRANELWRELEQESGYELFRQCGGVMFGVPGAKGYHNVADPFAATISAAEQHNIEHELLTPAQILDRWPMFGLNGNETAYVEPQSGVLFPERCVQAQLGLAIGHGARLTMNETVRSLESRKNHVRVTTEANRYTADKVIVAAGPWVKELLPKYQDQFELQRLTLLWFDLEDKSRVNYARYARMPRYGWAFGDGFYGFPALDGPEGGVKVACEDGLTVDSVAAVARRVSEAEIEHMYALNVRRRLPGLSPRCLKAQTCLYTMTPDGKFIIDYLPEDSRVLVLSPCNGNGFKHSAAIGEIAAQLTLRGESNVDIGAFTFGRLL